MWDIDFMQTTKKPLSAKAEMILTYLMMGLKNVDIADLVGLSEKSVKHHITKILDHYEGYNTTYDLYLDVNYPGLRSAIHAKTHNRI